VNAGVSTQDELLSRYERFQHTQSAATMQGLRAIATKQPSARIARTLTISGEEETGCSFSWNELSNITTDMG
jgi:hypothetical protein